MSSGAERSMRSRTTSSAFDAVDAALHDNRDTLKALFPMPAAMASQPARSTSNSTAPNAASLAARRAGTGIAVVALIVAGLVWLDPAYRHEHHATAIGEHRAVVLADGSRVTLDTASALDVAWHLRSRRTGLQRGQAQFEVAAAGPAPFGRPFEVAAGTTRIRVVGTVFGVQMQADRVTVTVVEGRVEVNRAEAASARAQGGSRTRLLGPGEQITHSSSEPALVSRVDAAAASAWKDGKLVFDHTPLLDALNEVQRYRSGAIRLTNNAAATRIAGLQLTGVFDTGRTDQLLDLLPKVLPVAVIRQRDGSVEVTPK